MGKSDDNEAKRLEELRREHEALSGQINEAQANKKALSEKRAELKAKKASEFADSVDMFKLNELVAEGGNLVDRTLKSKTFDRNMNLEAAIAKLSGAHDAVCKHLAELITKKKKCASEIEGLEAKLYVGSLSKAHRALLDGIALAEKIHAEFVRLLADAPNDVGSIATRQGLRDEFFLTSISRKPATGESLVDFIQWAAGRAIAGNPLYGSQRRKSSASDFKRGHVFNGVSINR